MFWDCFTYNAKGPCHIWTSETEDEDEKKVAAAVLKVLNEKLEPAAKDKWERTVAVRRVGHRRTRKPRNLKIPGMILLILVLEYHYLRL